MSRSRHIIKVSLASFVLFSSAPALAQAGFGGGDTGGIDYSTIFGPISELVISIAYLIGFILIFAGIHGVKKHGQNPQHYTANYCIANFLTGSALLSIGFIYGVVKVSTIDPSWTETANPLALSSHTAIAIGSVSQSFLGEYLPEKTIGMIVGFIYLVGLVSFIKGVFLLKNVGSVNNGQEGGIGKALTHMFGGVISMNIVDFGCIIGDTIGLPMMCLS